MSKEDIDMARSDCLEVIEDMCDQISRDLIEQREEDLADDDSTGREVAEA